MQYPSTTDWGDVFYTLHRPVAAATLFVEFIIYRESWRIGPKYRNCLFAAGTGFSSDGTAMVVLTPATADCFGHRTEVGSRAGRRRAIL